MKKTKKQKAKIEFNLRQITKLEYEIRDWCKLFLEHKITFAVLLERLKYRNVIKIKEIKSK